MYYVNWALPYTLPFTIINYASLELEGQLKEIHTKALN